MERERRTKRKSETTRIWIFLILHEKVRMLPEQLIGGHGSTEAKERERERGREKDVEKIKVDTERAKIHSSVFLFLCT